MECVGGSRGRIPKKSSASFTGLGIYLVECPALVVSYHQDGKVLLLLFARKSDTDFQSSPFFWPQEDESQDA